jgi:hypothetical protein
LSKSSLGFAAHQFGVKKWPKAKFVTCVFDLKRHTGDSSAHFCPSPATKPKSCAFPKNQSSFCNPKEKALENPIISDLT